MTSGIENPMRPERDKSRDGLLVGFVTQALANTVGTLVGGVLLGGVAIRIGVLKLNEDVLNELQYLAWLIALATPAVILISIATIWLLNWLDPAREERRRSSLLLVIQGTLWAGLAAAVLGHIFWQLVDGFEILALVAMIPVLAFFGIAIAAVRAFVRGKGRGNEKG